MEELKSENDGIITLRFAGKIEKPILNGYFLKKNFISGGDLSRDFTLEEINSINIIIRLGNKITKGYEDEKNNSGQQYNSNAKMIFEPGKDYEITKSQFEQLQKVFSFKSNFLEMNKKIEFEFADTRKVKMKSGANLSKYLVIKKLLQDNSIEGVDKDQKQIITFEPNKKYYLTLADIKLLSGRFEMDKAYPHLTSDCIHKNIFDVPLDILQSFVNDFGNLNYQKYIFKERAEKNSETKKNGIFDNLYSELIGIKAEYKQAKKAIEAPNLYKSSQNLKIGEGVNKIKEIMKTYGFSEDEIESEDKSEDKLAEIISNPKQLDEYFTNKVAGKIGGIIKDCGFHEIKSKDKLVELIKNPSQLDEYFINETVNKINETIKKCGFTEIKSEDKLLNTFESSLKTGLLNSEYMNLILTKTKDSLDETILQKSLNIIIENMLDGQLVDTKLINTLEAFLFSDWEICLDDLKEVLFGKTVKTGYPKEPQRKIGGLIKKEKADYVLESLIELKNDRRNVNEAIEMLSLCGFISKDIQMDDKFKIAVKDILSKKSSFLSHEHIVTILKAAAELESSEDESTDAINCVWQAVEKYKLDIEDKDPLKNVMRLFFNPGKIDKFSLEAITNEINYMLTEQIYTEMLNKRPALLFFIDIDFLYKKIIVDPNNNVFKKTFDDINKLVRGDADRFSMQYEKIDVQYFNSFLNRISQNNGYDFDRYCYYFISFIADRIKSYDIPSEKLAFFCMLISRLNYDFLYERIFSGDNNSETKNPIKNLLGMLFENGWPSYFAESYLAEYFRGDIDFNIVFGNDKNKINNIKDYCKYHPVYWAVIAHILSNLKYKPEYKDNFLYFFDLFNWNREDMKGGGYEAWLELFNFVDPRFLYGNLDVIERYLTCCKKSELMLSDEIESTIETICDYDNYVDCATGPKLNETDYFYTLLRYNEQCIDYFEPKWVFDHLKDEDMKNYYQWICDNAISKVEAMYQYITTKQYDKPEQQKQDILLLIEIFPDVMSQYIDAEFLIDNWDTFDLNFKKKCTDGEALIHFFDGLKNIRDIKKMERWYVDLLKICSTGNFNVHQVMDCFVDNYDKFSDEGLKTCINLYKQKGDEIYSCLLNNLFTKVNALGLKNGKYIDRKPKAEKTLQIIKTFGAKKASEHVDKEFLIKNLNDKDIGNTVKECIKLCAKADDEFCKSLCEVAMDEQFYKNFEDEDKRLKKENMIWALINIGREKIFEHVDNQFLLKNLDNEIIKGLINYASETKINYMFESINNLDCNDNAKIDMYYKLINYRPDLLVVLRSSYFNLNTNFTQALNKSILEKNISVLSFLNNYHSEEQNHNVRYFILNLINMKPCDTKTRLINAIACLDSFELQRISYLVYTYRNCAYLKFHVNNNNFSFYYPMNNREIARLAENLFKIHNQQACNLYLTDLVSGNCRLCCETIDSYLPEYHELSTIIKSSWKKYLWFVGVACFILLAIFISGFWVELLAINFLRHIPIILCCLLGIDLLSAIKNKDSFIFKKIFLSRNLAGYETKIKHEKEARHGFYLFLKDKLDFKKHIGIYDEVINNIKGKNVDIKKDFFDWLKANNKDEPFDKENDRNKKIDFVVDFILRAPNNEIIKKLDGVIETLEDFSNDKKAISLLDNWLNKNQNHNDCRDVLQSEFLDMIKFKSGELKIKLKRKDNIKTLAEKIYNQIIAPQDKKLDSHAKNNILINENKSEEEEINTSTKNIIGNNNQSENNDLIPLSESQIENQIEN